MIFFSWKTLGWNNSWIFYYNHNYHCECKELNISQMKNMVYNNYDLVLKGDKDSSILLKDYVNICLKIIKGGITTS